jgi:AraC-like DNA-binding protein
MIREYEIIAHPNIEMLNIFLVRLNYRSLHVHNEIEIGLVLDGEVEINMQEKKLILKSGDIYYLNAMEVHELNAQTNNAVILCVQFSPRFIAAYYPNIHKAFVMVSSLRDSFLQQEIRYQIVQVLCVELGYNFIARPLNYQFKCVSMLNMALFIIFSIVPVKIQSPEELAKRSSWNIRLKRILDYIDNNFQDKLLLGDIAQRERLSMTYLSHLFKDTLNKTFQDYVSEKRFDYACNLLKNTDDKIIDICLASGFSDVRYLNKMCRKTFGCTLKEYRKMLNEGDKTLKNTVTTQKMLSLGESIRFLAQIRQEWYKNLENCSIWDIYKNLEEK